MEIDLTKTAADRAEVAFHFVLNVPSDVPAGFYVPILSALVDGIPEDPGPLIVPIETISRRPQYLSYLPVVKIGNPAPPRIPAMLLAGTLNNGSRGGIAMEDRGRFAIATRLRMNETLIIPRQDATGAPIKYNLEPFLPTISMALWGRQDLPLIPFRFPSGHLSARITSPDGSVRQIEPAPFLQPKMKSNGESGETFSNPSGGISASTEISECYQLTTLEPRFNLEFPRDGRYVITLDGSIDDLWGNSWKVGGTYEVHVGRSLSIDSAMIPGTPLETGDIISPAVVIRPPVPADVEVRIRFAPRSDPAGTSERVIRGRADRFGYFNPRGADVAQNEAGEYRIDVIASFTDADGTAWFGGRTWGSVIAPRDTPIVAHGQRQMINSSEPGATWFFRSQTPFPLPSATHPCPPFNTGDVLWAQKSDTQFVKFTFQDPQGLVTSELRKRQIASGVGDVARFDERASLGELPLFSSRADGVEPHIDPSRVDLWGYSYRFVERPSLAVRELIAEDFIGQAYWPFGDQYGSQIGIGADGDLPNDFKFEFGGVALHGSALQQPLYAGYGALFILVPDDDKHGGTRIFPPFQGNGGGPSGGPLLTIKGKDIDLFFHPTSVRPGTILQAGERASFSGYSAPPLPSRVQIVLTSPSGKLQMISGRANAFGYFGDSSNIAMFETGVWKAKITITFDGRTSAGNVSPPFPTGDVLGTSSGEFFFYVVSPDSPPLTLVSMPKRVRPAERPVLFSVVPPPNLSDVQLSYSATMPGFLLEEGTSSFLTFTYDAQKLAKDFPNLDLRSSDGLTGVDPITISLLVSGTDSNGVRRHFARQIVLQGEELQIPEQKETIIPPRRRAAGH
jgi:hypothetical protein